jgi:hypothetical protein
MREWAMATIVQHKQTKGLFVLIGTGFGAWHSSRPDVLFGDVALSGDTGSTALVAVAGVTGEVGWVPSDQVVVVSIDGKTPHEHLSASA